MSRKRLAYCDVCRKKIMPLTDEDWNNGKSHSYICKREVCEPKEEDLEADIELVVWSRKIGVEYLAVDLCQDCVERMLREVLDGGNEDE